MVLNRLKTVNARGLMLGSLLGRPNLVGVSGDVVDNHERLCTDRDSCFLFCPLYR
jgi:hypothetical protein